MLRLATIYSLFVLYGTTIPFHFGISHDQLLANINRISWIPFVDPDGTWASLPDVVQNILLFAPLGVFVALGAARRLRSCVARVAVAGAWGLALSAGLESLQLFTLDRTTSPTDVVTNTAGAIVGAVAAIGVASWWSMAAERPSFRRFLGCGAAFPALVAMGAVVVGAWEPFDFTLDVGSVVGKARALWMAPIDFPSVLSDEPAAILRMALLVLAVGCWLREAGVPHARARAAALSLGLGMALEAGQIIVGSRMPGVQDALAACLGVGVGAVLAPSVAQTTVWTRWIWAVVAATALSAAVSQLSPFRFTAQASGIEFVPFMAHYERTSMLALSDFFEAALLYFPMGFVIAMNYGHRRVAWVLPLTVTALVSVPLEFAQQHVVGRYADISDPIFALVGAAAGVYAWRAGWGQRVGTDVEGSGLTSVSPG